MNAVNVAFAEKVALELYGLNATAKTLVGEYDKNFQLRSEQGEFILKIMHPEAERETLELQIAALEHLAGHADLTAPRVQRTKDNRLVSTIDAPDGKRLVWLLSYIPGKLYADTKPHTPALLESFGNILARFDKALLNFEHPAARRNLKWDLAKAEWIKEHAESIADKSRQTIVQHILKHYLETVQPALSTLRHSVIHNDANDYNVLVHKGEVSSLIDFGDMLYAPTLCNLAIAAAYALMNHDDPLAALVNMVRGYQAVLPLSEKELGLLFPLVQMRLAVSVTNSAVQKRLRPDDPYITVSEKPAWNLLEKLGKIPPRFAYYSLLHACNLGIPNSKEVRGVLKKHHYDFASVLGKPLEAYHVLDLTPSSSLYEGDPRVSDTPRLSKAINEEMHSANVKVSVGRYDEPRLLYASSMFARTAAPTAERRTVHIGLDLFTEAGVSVHAPLDAVVAGFANNTEALDYGPVIVLRHELDGTKFYTLYGHLSVESLDNKKIGQVISKGEAFATLGAAPINGNWPPHLHFQILVDDLDLLTDFPGVAYPNEREVFKALCPDPNLMLGLDEKRLIVSHLDLETHITERKSRLGRNLSISYRQPIVMDRAYMQYMVDNMGQRYLDMYNNVPHVGHNHPHVVNAAQKQFAKLNTNTRYLNQELVRYAERLTATLPAPLSVVFMTASGSEANELALRLARTYTNNYDIIAMTSGYHGHTTSMIDISQYKFGGPGGKGAPEWVHLVPVADCYRGEFKYDDANAGEKYASSVRQTITEANSKGRNIAAFICETFPSVGGQIVLPEGYLKHAYQHVRAAGGVCIADEVQTGFGRIGTHFWGFQKQEVVPDIVVLGKPIGNGYPMGAVITTLEIADAFNNGMEYFSTFGGNSVACAVGNAVLDVLEQENLQAHSLELGHYLLGHLRPLVNAHPLVGDVRGSGLFLGIELVRDKTTLEPAASEASYVANRMRDHGILLGTDGPHHNVVKMRGPLPFSKNDADFFLEVLNNILEEDALRVA
jgi:4-aminobutyrate aminotransferase-like enzyme/Ser/Thr protein kinase RdoA (MazF antagonist)/murein DD-endopeptidase MepM/ murein hydrolase activator NlpD